MIKLIIITLRIIIKDLVIYKKKKNQILCPKMKNRKNQIRMMNMKKQI